MKPPFKIPLEIEGENEKSCVKDGDGNYVIAMTEFPGKKYDEALELHLKYLEYIVDLVNRQ